MYGIDMEFWWERDAKVHAGECFDEAPELPTTNETCADCKGSGQVSLLFSVRKCKGCGGTGRLVK